VEEIVQIAMAINTVNQKMDTLNLRSPGTDVKLDVPRCSDTKYIYIREAYAALSCPILFGSDTQSSTLQKVIPGNPDVSAACATPDVVKYCGEDYCPDNCFVDRLQTGPQMCELEDLTDPKSDIYTNQKRCPDCYIDTIGDKSIGPQCQVLLLTPDEPDGVLPANCSASDCYPLNEMATGYEIHR
jgi:hypothetical protein